MYNIEKLKDNLKDYLRHLLAWFISNISGGVEVLRINFEMAALWSDHTLPPTIFKIPISEGVCQSLKAPGHWHYTTALISMDLNPTTTIHCVASTHPHTHVLISPHHELSYCARAHTHSHTHTHRGITDYCFLSVKRQKKPTKNHETNNTNNTSH